MYWLRDVIFIIDLFAYEHVVPLKITPTNAISFNGGSVKLNRLLPKGRRWRGDVGVYE